ncbi:uncharacterized protein LOC121099366 [Falco naumanni]|uniref:uncharacterized protein LOC121099366 n=1 Tax=Falco naumanni TaxID=148594 RepID=UPI001ADE0BB3|nr:uncharacterized protein LOC121099366 [Falco naumanni]
MCPQLRGPLPAHHHRIPVPATSLRAHPCAGPPARAPWVLSPPDLGQYESLRLRIGAETGNFHPFRGQVPPALEALLPEMHPEELGWILPPAALLPRLPRHHPGDGGGHAVRMGRAACWSVLGKPHFPQISYKSPWKSLPLLRRSVRMPLHHPYSLISPKRSYVNYILKGWKPHLWVQSRGERAWSVPPAAVPLELGEVSPRVEDLGLFLFLNKTWYLDAVGKNLAGGRGWGCFCSPLWRRHKDKLTQPLERAWTPAPGERRGGLCPNPSCSSSSPWALTPDLQLLSPSLFRRLTWKPGAVSLPNA